MPLTTTRRDIDAATETMIVSVVKMAVGLRENLENWDVKDLALSRESLIKVKTTLEQQLTIVNDHIDKTDLVITDRARKRMLGDTSK
jgi:hypothetical protein